MDLKDYLRGLRRKQYLLKHLPQIEDKLRELTFGELLNMFAGEIQIPRKRKKKSPHLRK